MAILRVEAELISEAMIKADGIIEQTTDSFTASEEALKKLAEAMSTMDVAMLKEGFATSGLSIEPVTAEETFTEQDIEEGW